MRQVRCREPARYIEQALAGRAVARDDEVARAELPFEFMLNALRLNEGFALAQFTERTGLPLTAPSPRRSTRPSGAGSSSATGSTCGRRRAASIS